MNMSGAFPASGCLVKHELQIHHMSHKFNPMWVCRKCVPQRLAPFAFGGCQLCSDVICPEVYISLVLVITVMQPSPTSDILSPKTPLTYEQSLPIPPALPPRGQPWGYFLSVDMGQPTLGAYHRWNNAQFGLL